MVPFSEQRERVWVCIVRLISTKSLATTDSRRIAARLRGSLASFLALKGQKALTADKYHTTKSTSSQSFGVIKKQMMLAWFGSHRRPAMQSHSLYSQGTFLSGCQFKRLYASADTKRMGAFPRAVSDSRPIPRACSLKLELEQTRALFARCRLTATTKMANHLRGLPPKLLLMFARGHSQIGRLSLSSQVNLLLVACRSRALASFAKFMIEQRPHTKSICTICYLFQLPRWWRRRPILERATTTSDRGDKSWLECKQ